MISRFSPDFSNIQLVSHQADMLESYRNTIGITITVSCIIRISLRTASMSQGHSKAAIETKDTAI